ncbi:biotin synthase [Neocallimastix lanati (nom. inval.)]|jgi:biotin synthase|uniref:biotin synthase n=1 Tax=Neocallimastix californiae TaxID=1754190 RepID=A0A1Y2FE74_9FUNG|nr:biotin synthase [Neocallimastix sp. JGI-2020a]ORY82219.1 biotin synthase [Neocallimastix californiae]|eukprot:ORY82219.1 biotin synthase [Neocallimastix californiae]
MLRNITYNFQKGLLNSISGRTINSIKLSQFKNSYSTLISQLKQEIINGQKISKNKALQLVDSDLEDLCTAANEIRKYFCGDEFEICTIINAKSGKCTEDCKYCAQSAHYKVKVNKYPLVNTETMLAAAKKDDAAGVQRFSPVTSGKRLRKSEVESLCKSMREIKKNTNLKICASCGLLKSNDFKKMKEAGLSRYHNNMESSRNFFKTVCTTHSTDDKINTIKLAKEQGLEICSGGIMGLGESWNDRIDMAFLVNELGAVSIPINMLSPIPGTPYEKNRVLSIEEMRRICAIYRFINPKAFIRLAGGRGLLKDKGRSCFLSGANAVISGDMLTTSGITIKRDLQMIKELGFHVTK